MQPLGYQETIDSLNQILTESYFSYLTYDPSDPRNREIKKLVLNVTGGTSDYSKVTADANKIGGKLKETTGRSYKAYAAVGDGRSPKFVTLHEDIEKRAVNPDTGIEENIKLPASEIVRQIILELEYPDDGISVKDASVALAEKLELSDEQKSVRNSSNLNLFRHNVVSPQFKRLLEEGELKQPEGSRTPYLLAGSSSESSNMVLRETSPEPEYGSSAETVERTAVDPNTGEAYQIKLPVTRIVKEALLDFDYPASGIRIRDIAEVLADQFGLTDEQRNAKYTHGLVWRFYVNVAANTLVDSEKLLRIRRGWITNPEQPDVETSDPEGDSLFSDGDTPSPEVFIEQNYRNHRDKLKEELRQKIRDNPPDFFEELVLDLLVKMGYGGSRADAEAVGRSGDGGIDGIIKEDELGLDLIYIQAKRQQGSVPVHLVRDFTGALDCKGARKGIFITTSDFTQPAKDFVDEVSSKRIILIDGNQLVQLMIDRNLGVSLGNFYQLKEVDLDYFAIDDAVDDN